MKCYAKSVLAVIILQCLSMGRTIEKTPSGFFSVGGAALIQKAAKGGVSSEMRTGFLSGLINSYSEVRR